jgi:hypothetical protein
VGIVGDSKSTSTAGTAWPQLLLAALNTATNADLEYWEEESPRNMASSGATVASRKSSIDSELAEHTETVTDILLDLGVNDLSAMPLEAAWKADMLYIIDAIATKWPSVRIYVCKPWCRGYTTEANTMAGWIDDIVALRSTNCKAGHDERTWLEGGDDGATMTVDGKHYSTPAGQNEAASQWQTLLIFW